MLSASRNSLPSPVSDEENGRWGVQSVVRGGLSPRREKMERILVKEKEKEVGRTSSEPSKMFK
jgi:hypothetical protein